MTDELWVLCCIYQCTCVGLVPCSSLCFRWCVLRRWRPCSRVGGGPSLSALGFRRLSADLAEQSSLSLQITQNQRQFTVQRFVLSVKKESAEVILKIPWIRREMSNVSVFSGNPTDVVVALCRCESAWENAAVLPGKSGFYQKS